MVTFYCFDCCYLVWFYIPQEDRVKERCLYALSSSYPIHHIGMKRQYVGKTTYTESGRQRLNVIIFSVGKALVGIQYSVFHSGLNGRGVGKVKEGGYWKRGF